MPVLLLALLLTGCGPAVETAVPGDTALPPDLDSDGDGIPDVQERQEGTDPQDPSSASAWHPEVTARPRLLLAPEALDRLRERLAAPEEPWATLATRLRATCAVQPWPDDDDMTAATVNGNVALACAVLHAAGEEGAGARAVAALEGLQVAAPLDVDTVYYVDLHGGQGLLQGVRAWDLLLGAGYPDGADPAVARARLLDLGDFLWGTYVEDYPEFMAFAQNNHATKLASAFGLLGMGVNDDPGAAARVNYGVAEVARLHDLLLAEDGGYAEGFSYQVYAMESVLPWLSALDAWLGDGTMLVRTLCTHSRDVDCQEAVIPLGSPLRDPRVCDGFERFVEALMPSGHAPNLDDGNLATGHLGYTAGLCGSGTQAWGWDRQAATLAAEGSVHLTADTLLWFDPDLPATAPSDGVVLRPAAGWAVLRQSWAEDAGYALLLAEAGVARDGGGGHEHPDALAVLWAARGQYLLLDGGYGAWGMHEDVNEPEAHNVVLVDGENTLSADAADLEAWTVGPFQLARARVAMGGVAWTRTVARVAALAGEDRVLVVRDELAPTDGVAHRLDLRVHGAGPEAIPGPDGATWNVGDLELQVAVLASVPVERSVLTGPHALSYGTLETHGVLSVALDAAAPVVFLTVATAARGGDEHLAVEGDLAWWREGWASVAGTLVQGEATVDLASSR